MPNPSPFDLPGDVAAVDKLGYISLTTYRKDGRAVATPVWFAVDGRDLVVTTEATSGKVKRIRNNPSVTVAPCDARGTVKGPAYPATAEIIADERAARRVEQLVLRKYGPFARVVGALNTVRSVVQRRQRVEGACLRLRVDAPALS